MAIKPMDLLEKIRTVNDTAEIRQIIESSWTTDHWRDGSVRYSLLMRRKETYLLVESGNERTLYEVRIDLNKIRKGE